MGRYCDRWEEGQVTQAVPFRDELVCVALEFSRGTTLAVDPGVEATIVAVFDRTIGQALATGESWDTATRSFVARYARIWAREAERAARSAGLDRISVAVAEAAAEHMILRAREAERRRTAA